MKVVDPGEQAGEWTRQCKCRQCKAVLEVCESDLKVGEFGGNYAESGNDEPYVQCAQCGCDIKLEWGDLWPNVQRRLRNSKEKR